MAPEAEIAAENRRRQRRSRGGLRHGGCEDICPENCIEIVSATRIASIPGDARELSPVIIGNVHIGSVMLKNEEVFVPFPQVDVEFLYCLRLTQKQRFVALCGGSTFLE